MEFQSPDTPVLGAVTIDCNDLEAMVEFWAALLGVESEIHEPFAFLEPAPGRTGAVWLQRVPEPATGKNRLHLDFVVPDLAACEDRIESLGGRIVETQSWERYEWRVCADPEGNLFDVMQAPADRPE